MRFTAEVDFDGAEIARKYVRNSNIDFNLLSNSLDNPEKLEAFLVKYGKHQNQFKQFITAIIGDGVIDALGLEVDRIEEEIKQQVPEVKFVELETH